MSVPAHKVIKYVKAAKRAGAKWETVKATLIEDFGLTELDALLIGGTYFARNKS
jgi:hypothetical protein